MASWDRSSRTRETLPALRPAPGGPDPPNPPGRLALPSTIRRHHGPVTLSHFANGHRRLDIHDHRMPEIDKVVVAIGVDRQLVGRGRVAGSPDRSARSPSAEPASPHVFFRLSLIEQRNPAAAALLDENTPVATIQCRQLEHCGVILASENGVGHSPQANVVHPTVEFGRASAANVLVDRADPDTYRRPAWCRV